MADPVVRGALGAALAAAIALTARRAGSLSGSGAAAAWAVGTIVVAGGGWWAGLVLVAFFATSSALSHLGKRARGDDAVEAKGSRRDASQVLANGGVAAICCAVAGLAPDPAVRNAAVAAFLGSIAAVTADTWATEIGRFSRRPPRSVLNGRVVAPGMSGGITPLGTAASALGAAMVGALGAAGGLAAAGPWAVVTAVTAAGLAGSLADSVAGAAIQARYRCPECGLPTERRVHRCGARTELTGGVPWVTNETVNVIAAITGAAIGVLLLGR